MNYPFSVLPGLPLRSGSSFGAETQPFSLVDLESPALAVMTDFTSVTPVTISPDLSIDSAVGRMKGAGVRLLFVVNVVNDDYDILGLITATDIAGERPIKLSRQTGASHYDIKVSSIMTPQSGIQVLDYTRVANSQVGDIVATLKALERQHALVAKIDRTGAQSLVGMFSTSKIGKMLGHNVAQATPAAHSLAEMLKQIG
jgi:CBS-domain-containing membrane protein